MRRVIVHCALLIYLLPAASGAFDGVSSRDVHIWRGEFEHALVAGGDELDMAAYLTLAGDHAGALELLEGSHDSLRLGILACRAEDFGTAIDLLVGPERNPYLEAYRLLHRATALEAAESYAEAVRELSLLLRTDASSALGMRPLELIVRASYRAGITPDSIRASMGDIDRLYGVSSLMLADRLLEEERIEEAHDTFLEGIDAAPDTLSRRLFNELFDGLGGPARFRKTELVDIAWAALSFDEPSLAARVIEEIQSRFNDDPDAALLRGALLEAEGERRRALRVYDNIFESGAPVELKKEALLRRASTEYDLGRHVRAAESYRLFGLYYPGDRRSSFALDIAARILVSREKQDEALRVWGRLRDLGRDDSISIEAALSEAALRYARSEPAAAYGILKTLLSRGGRRVEPAAFYWLHLTAGTESERSVWKRRLIDAYPHSFYSAAAESGNAPFRLPDNGESHDAKGIIENLEQRERGFVLSVRETMRPGEDLYRDDAYEALVYFLERGFIEETRSCVAMLEHLYGSDTAAMASLYATVRSSGLVDVGLKLLWAKSLSGEDSPVDHSLRYPVAYSSFVSREAVRNRLPDELLLAVIREESSFDRFAVSRVGALGLMQLMPRTGAWIGEKIKRNGIDDGDILSPEFNIAAGAWYLRYLLDRSGNSIVAALASYNGGETRLSGWRKRFDPAEQPLLAIEMIGPRETRRYVKRVLDSMTSYRSMAMIDTESP